MSLTALFRNLNAPLANQRWSWGAERTDGAVFLRVWQDRKKKIDGKWYIMLLHPESHGEVDRLGFRERSKHVEMIKQGATCYMVMCLAKDSTSSPRVIKSFNERDIFVGGGLVELEGYTWIELANRIPRSEL